MSKKVRVGVAGMGSAGTIAAGRAADSLSCELTAICDLDEERGRAWGEQYDAHYHPTVDALCADDDVDAVYISTPTHLHAEHVVAASRAGKHVLVEKPIAQSAEAAARMVEAVSEAGVVGMCVNTRGGDAGVRALRRLIDEGTVGAVVHVSNLSFTDWLLRPRFAYELDPALGGGVVFRQAPHQVEVLRTLLGTLPTSVTASVSWGQEPVATVSSFQALLGFPDGVSASIVYNGRGYFNSAELTYGRGEGGQPVARDAGVELRRRESWNAAKYGAHGRARKAGEDARPPLLGYAGLTIVSGQSGDMRLSPTGVTVYDDSGIREVEVDPLSGGLPVDFEEFASAVAGTATLTRDLAWGLETVRVCEAIAHAALPAA